MTAKKITKQTIKKKTAPDVVVEVDIITPDTFYDVQDALQKLGVTMIDLDTGNEIDGLVNFLDIGMIHPNSPRKPKRSLGFITSLTQEYESRQIDATLHQFPEGNQPNKPTPIMIKVVMDSDLEKWLDIIAKIAPNFIFKYRGKLKSSVIFSITTLGIAGKDPEALKTAILGKIQNFGKNNDSGGSYFQLVGGDSFYDDDFDEKA